MGEPFASVCGACGVLAPGDVACPACGAAGRRVRASVAEGRWARIECRLTCPECGFLHPVNHLDVDGRVACVHCGLVDGLDPELWRRALGWAHGVADLGRTSAVGVVRDGRFVHHRTTMTTRASPGVPICGACQVALDVVVEPARVTSVCPSCGARAAYRLAPGALALHAPLRAVLAEAARTDRAESVAEARARGGAVALECPSCGAALSPERESYAVTCSYCHVVSRISASTWKRLGVEATRAEGIWALFDGPTVPAKTSSRQDDFQTIVAERAAAAGRAKGARGEKAREAFEGELEGRGRPRKS